MNFNARILEFNDITQARDALSLLGADPAGIAIMENKAVFKLIKLENISAKAANLLKQTFLAKGGDVAVARGTADLSVETTDVIIMATFKQYRLALAQLKSQPWGLPKVACAIESVLETAAHFPSRHYQWRDRELRIEPGRTLIMGILNITPDSFSDGGKFNNLEVALRHAGQMVDDGAAIIDIGAESTRPYGAQVVSQEQELDRLMPVLERLVNNLPVPISVDTYKAGVANEALKAGAHIINDVWGLQFDDNMASVIAAHQAPVIVMHNQTGTEYNRDIVAEICSFLRMSIKKAIAAGIPTDNIIIDPGIGFGKTPAHNLTVMSRLEELRALGCPILLGASRKRFIGEILNVPVEDRVEGTGATVTVGITKGINIVRVHDVKAMARIAKMTDAILRG